MRAHALGSRQGTCCGEGIPLLKSSFLFGFALSWFSICSLARDIDGSLSASLISSWIFFFFQTTVWNNYWNIVHNKLEVCCRLPQIELWLYTIVLTFQTALSTFILITHLCIDFSFKNACSERHRYPVWLMIYYQNRFTSAWLVQNFVDN